MAPLLAWEAFSLTYYGFLTPNTAFAKLNTGVLLPELLKHGIWYLIHSTAIDYFTSLVLLVGSALVLWKGKAQTRAIVCGVLLYLAYVVSFGGDFMSGRFLCRAALLHGSSPRRDGVALGRCNPSRLRSACWRASPSWVSLAPYSPVWGDRTYPCSQPFPLPTGVVDERGCYFPGTGLVRQQWRTALHARARPVRLGPEDA